MSQASNRVRLRKMRDMLISAQDEALTLGNTLPKRHGDIIINAGYGLGHSIDLIDEMLDQLKAGTNEP